MLSAFVESDIILNVVARVTCPAVSYYTKVTLVKKFTVLDPDLEMSPQGLR
jgi:hypothetical protein